MKKLLNFRPALYLALNIVLGILISYTAIFGYVLFLVLLSIIFIAIQLLFILMYKGGGYFSGKGLVKLKIIFLAITLIMTCVSGLIFTTTITDYDNKNLPDGEYTFRARVSEITEGENGKSLVLTDLVFDDPSIGKLKHKCSLFVYDNCTVKLGDVVIITTVVTNRYSIYDNKFSATYVDKGIKYTAKISGENILVLHNTMNIFDRANLFIKDSLMQGMGRQEFGVSYALLCGNSDFIDEEVLQSFRSAGVAHIFAVSGLHIGFFALILNFICDKLNFNKLLKFFVVLIPLIFYSGVCGFTSSSIRATVMTGVLLISGLVGEKYDGLSSISIALIIILLFRPLQLFCVGFQLSFVVVFGLLVMAKPFSKLFKFLPKKLASMLGGVLSAQLFSIPIMLMSYGSCSLISVIMNLVLLPFIGVVYIVLLITTVIGGAFSISTITLFIPSLAIKIIVAIINYFDYSMFMVTGITLGVFVILYYLAILIATDVINLSKIAKVVSCVLLALVFVGSTAFSTIDYAISSKVIAVGEDKVCATVLSAKSENVMVINKSFHTFPISRIRRAVDRLRIDKLDALIFTDGDGSFDVMSATSLVLATCEVKKVYYYYDYSDEVEKMMKNSFEKIKFIHCKQGDSISDSQIITFEYVVNGLGVAISKDQTKVCLLSKIPSKTYLSFFPISQTFDLVISTSYADYISELIDAKRYVSYLTNGDMPSAQKMGNFVLKI